MDADAVLPVLPWTAAALAVVLLVGLQVPPPARPARRTTTALSPVARPRGALLLGVVLGALALAARLLGDSELDNPVSPLVVGLGWPLLLLVPLLLSPLLSRLRPRQPYSVPGGEPGSDPGGEPGGEAGDVRPALPLALLVVLLLVGVPAPGRPQVLGPALGAYGVLLLAAGLAGGLALAGRADVLGLLARWSALGPRLPGWAAPRGAAAVLVLVLGGAWAERYGRSSAFVTDLPGTRERLVLLVVAVAVAAALALPLRRYGPAAVLLPLAVGAVGAGGLRRALISGQLLAGTGSVTPDPLGVAGGQLLSLAVVTALGAAAAAVLARRAAPAGDRLPGLAAVLALTGVTAWLALQP